MTKKTKKKGDGKAGKKKPQSRYKDPSKMCCDPFPMYAYDVKDVNKTNKVILLTIICILWCFSVVVVCVGAYLIAQRKEREEVISAGNFSEFWLNFSLVLLCNGLVSCVITYCGLVGVLRENIALIRLFYICLMVALLLKLALAVFVFVFADYSRPLLERMLAEQAVVDYRDSSDVETLMDYLQSTFHCCGLRDDGFQDWSRNVYFNCSDANPSPERCGVPWSCCRNHTGITNALCGLGVQRVDRNIASRTIHTLGCLHAVQRWVVSHAVVAGLLGLLEVSALLAVTFQCTRLVNELQMITGVYRGPWWDRRDDPRRRRRHKSAPPPPGHQLPRTPPPDAAAADAEQSPSPGGEEVSDDESRTRLPAVVQIGHGPAVRRNKTAPPTAKGSSAPLELAADEAGRTPEQQQQEKELDPSDSTEAPPAIVVLNSDGQVIGDRVFATTFRAGAAEGTEPDGGATELTEVGEMLDSAAEQSYFCPPGSEEAVAAASREGSAGSNPGAGGDGSNGSATSRDVADGSPDPDGSAGGTDTIGGTSNAGGTGSHETVDSQAVQIVKT